MLIPTVLPSKQPSVLPDGTTHAVLNDDAAIHALVRLLIKRSGLTIKEIADRMNVKWQSVAQFQYAKRPSVRWLTRLCAVTGAELVVKFPRNM